MEKVKSIRINQDPLKWGKHNNGGEYGFSQFYFREKPEQNFKVCHSTTADFDFCYVFGVFKECSRCDKYDCFGQGCIANLFTVPEETMLEILKKTEENSIDNYVSYIAKIEEF